MSLIEEKPSTEAIAAEQESVPEEREISKPRILEAPYALENAGNPSVELFPESGLAAYAEAVSKEAPIEAQVEYHTHELPATLPLHSGTVLRVVEPVEIKEPEPDPVEQVAAFVLGFQRELETLQDNLAKMFKQMGHGDEWNRIILR